MPSSDDTIIISGGRTTGEYWAEYEGKRIKLTGWRLFAVRRVAAWVYSYFGG